MRRHPSMGWLIAVLLVLTSGPILLVLVPVQTCPLCLSLGSRTLILAMRPTPLLNCPTCDDSGKVTVLRAWRSPTLAPQVAELLRVQDKSNGRDLDTALESIIVAGGKDPQVVLGKNQFRMQSPRGEVRFMTGDERGRLLVLLTCGPSEKDSMSLVLLDPKGVVLDVLSATCVKAADFSADLMPWQTPGGLAATVSIEAELAEVPALVWWYDERGRIPESRIPAPPREKPKVLQFRIGVEGDRLRIIPSAAPPAGP